MENDTERELSHIKMHGAKTQMVTILFMRERKDLIYIYIGREVEI